MSTIEDFNRIDDCNKIDPLCIDAYTDFELRPQTMRRAYVFIPHGAEIALI